MAYFVYMALCADGTFYTGIATDIERRLIEHNGVTPGARGKGARYTAARRPVTLAFQKACGTRSEALKEEARLKRLSRRDKQQLAGAAVLAAPVRL